ncbi:MMPL family transporter [Cellulomonas sp. HZM]|uniref:MMPL family transporter n=1 Tax=Cellulomonas sp. HZM TaxID=1454010 RepID=UPI0004932FFD|nr:MMPL family transporter [Cellulomonas sp. HZM]
MAELLYRLGRFSARRAWVVLAGWAAVLAIAVAAFVAFGGSLASTLSIPGTPTAEVTDRLAKELPAASGGTGAVVFHTDDDSAMTKDQQAGVSAALADAAKVDGVTTVVDPFASTAQREEQAAKVTQGEAQVKDARAQVDDAQTKLDDARTQTEGAIKQSGETPELKAALAQLDAQQKQLDEQRAKLDASQQQLDQARKMLDMSKEIRTVSSNGAAAIGTVVFDEQLMSVTPETKQAVTDAIDAGLPDGVAAEYSTDLTQGTPQLGGVSEAIGLAVAAIVLVVMLGTLVAAGLPLLNAILGVGVAVAGAMALSGTVEMTSVTPILGAMLGLAVGIDYSLFILNRHRRQLRAGMPVHESIGLANGTSGNAVVFAGSTVLIALLALNVTGIPFLGLMGTVAAGAIAVAVLVAVTMTPALLGLLGQRVLPRRQRVTHATPATTTPATPMRTGSAVLRIVVGVGVLAAVAIPSFSMRLGLPTGDSEPADSTQYRAYTTIARDFGPGANGPLVVVADLPGGATGDDLTAAQATIGSAITAADDVAAVAPVGANKAGSVLVFQVVPAEGPSSESTEELVHALRDTTVEVGGETVPLAVAGSASAAIDISEKLSDALPVYLAVVIGLSFCILVLVFRSLLVPLVATGGFVLSLFAALGGVTAVYQWGWLPSVFGVHNPGPVLSFLPTLLVGILFGLAMDYQLFLTSGMREAYAHGSPARRAVVEGVHAGRTVVTAAAIIMISVFGGFMFSDVATIRPLGFGLAFGVLVDAFLMRMLIIPAVLHLAGDGAWWLPRWLDRLLPDVDVEGANLERHHHAPAGADV